jgi:hypothetical protein
MSNPVNPLWLDRGYYISRAARYYQEYMLVQEKITAAETEALQQAQGDRRAAAVVLLKPREDTDASFYYKSLCGNRDMWMQRAQLASSMAIMLGNHENREVS